MSERSRIRTGWARMRAWQRGYRRAALAAALAGKGERVPERKSPRLARLFRDAGLLSKPAAKSVETRQYAVGYVSEDRWAVERFGGGLPVNPSAPIRGGA